MRIETGPREPNHRSHYSVSPPSRRHRHVHMPLFESRRSKPSNKGQARSTATIAPSSSRDPDNHHKRSNLGPFHPSISASASLLFSSVPRQYLPSTSLGVSPHIESSSKRIYPTSIQPQSWTQSRRSFRTSPMLSLVHPRIRISGACSRPSLALSPPLESRDRAN